AVLAQERTAAERVGRGPRAGRASSCCRHPPRGARRAPRLRGPLAVRGTARRGRAWSRGKFDSDDKRAGNISPGPGAGAARTRRSAAHAPLARGPRGLEEGSASGGLGCFSATPTREARNSLILATLGHPCPRETPPDAPYRRR